MNMCFNIIGEHQQVEGFILEIN